MKRIFNLLVAGVVATSLMMTQSCTDKVCDAGYEGSDCKTEVRTKFIGSWRGNETCTTGTDLYTITVTGSSSDVVKINISNIYNQNLTGYATVDGTSFDIPSQTVGTGASGNITASGTGSLTGDSLTVAYTVSSSVGSNSCTFKGAKL